MFIKLKDINISDKIHVREWGGGISVGIVDAVEEDIKNVRPGVDYVRSDGDSFWCYLDQIEKLFKAKQ
jgi:hypothetical protein